MLSRTKQSVVRFSEAFSLVGVEQILSPGEYTIIEDQELIEGISWLAYRRVGTFIELPPCRSNGHMMQMVSIDHGDLEATLFEDTKKARPALKTASAIYQRSD